MTTTAPNSEKDALKGAHLVRVGLNTPEASKLLQITSHTNIDPEFWDRYWRISAIYKVHNESLKKAFFEFKDELRKDLKPEQVREILVFANENKKAVEEISREGCRAGTKKRHILGHAGSGVHLVRHYDILTRYLAAKQSSAPCFVMVHKAILGKTKPIVPRVHNDENFARPYFAFDCHVSARQVQSKMPISDAYKCSNVFFYEHDEKTSTVECPRQILPHAVIELETRHPIHLENPFLAVGTKFSQWEVKGETRRGFRFVLSKQTNKSDKKPFTRKRKIEELKTNLQDQLLEMRTRWPEACTQPKVSKLYSRKSEEKSNSNRSEEIDSFASITSSVEHQQKLTVSGNPVNRNEEQQRHKKKNRMEEFKCDSNMECDKDAKTGAASNRTSNYLPLSLKPYVSLKRLSSNEKDNTVTRRTYEQHEKKDKKADSDIDKTIPVESRTPIKSGSTEIARESIINDTVRTKMTGDKETRKKKLHCVDLGIGGNCLSDMLPKTREIEDVSNTVKTYKDRCPKGGNESSPANSKMSAKHSKSICGSSHVLTTETRRQFNKNWNATMVNERTIVGNNHINDNIEHDAKKGGSCLVTKVNSSDKYPVLSYELKQGCSRPPVITGLFENDKSETRVEFIQRTAAATTQTCLDECFPANKEACENSHSETELEPMVGKCSKPFLDTKLVMEHFKAVSKKNLNKMCMDALRFTNPEPPATESNQDTPETRKDQMNRGNCGEVQQKQHDTEMEQTSKVNTSCDSSDRLNKNESTGQNKQPEEGCKTNSLKEIAHERITSFSKPFLTDSHSKSSLKHQLNTAIEDDNRKMKEKDKRVLQVRREGHDIGDDKSSNSCGSQNYSTEGNVPPVQNDNTSQNCRIEGNDTNRKLQETADTKILSQNLTEALSLDPPPVFESASSFFKPFLRVPVSKPSCTVSTKEIADLKRADTIKPKRNGYEHKTDVSSRKLSREPHEQNLSRELFSKRKSEQGRPTEAIAGQQFSGAESKTDADISVNAQKSKQKLKVNEISRDQLKSKGIKDMCAKKQMSSKNVVEITDRPKSVTTASFDDTGPDGCKPMSNSRDNDGDARSMKECRMSVSQKKLSRDESETSFFKPFLKSQQNKLPSSVSIEKKRTTKANEMSTSLRDKGTTLKPEKHSANSNSKEMHHDNKTNSSKITHSTVQTFTSSIPNKIINRQLVKIKEKKTDNMPASQNTKHTKPVSSFQQSEFKLRTSSAESHDTSFFRTFLKKDVDNASADESISARLDVENVSKALTLTNHDTKCRKTSLMNISTQSTGEQTLISNQHSNHFNQTECHKSMSGKPVTLNKIVRNIPSISPPAGDTAPLGLNKRPVVLTASEYAPAAPVSTETEYLDAEAISQNKLCVRPNESNKRNAGSMSTPNNGEYSLQKNGLLQSKQMTENQSEVTHLVRLSHEKTQKHETQGYENRKDHSVDKLHPEIAKQSEKMQTQQPVGKPHSSILDSKVSTQTTNSTNKPASPVTRHTPSLPVRKENESNELMNSGGKVKDNPLTALKSRVSVDEHTAKRIQQFLFQQIALKHQKPLGSPGQTSTTAGRMREPSSKEKSISGRQTPKSGADDATREKLPRKSETMTVSSNIPQRNGAITSANSKSENKTLIKNAGINTDSHPQTHCRKSQLDLDKRNKLHIFGHIDSNDPVNVNKQKASVSRALSSSKLGKSVDTDLNINDSQQQILEQSVMRVTKDQLKIKPEKADLTHIQQLSKQNRHTVYEAGRPFNSDGKQLKNNEQETEEKDTRWNSTSQSEKDNLKSSKQGPMTEQSILQFPKEKQKVRPENTDQTHMQQISKQNNTGSETNRPLNNGVKHLENKEQETEKIDAQLNTPSHAEQNNLNSAKLTQRECKSAIIQTLQELSEVLQFLNDSKKAKEVTNAKKVSSEGKDSSNINENVTTNNENSIDVVSAARNSVNENKDLSDMAPETSVHSSRNECLQELVQVRKEEANNVESRKGMAESRQSLGSQNVHEIRQLKSNNRYAEEFPSNQLGKVIVKTEPLEDFQAGNIPQKGHQQMPLVSRNVNNENRCTFDRNRSRMHTPNESRNANTKNFSFDSTLVTSTSLGNVCDSSRQNTNDISDHVINTLPISPHSSFNYTEDREVIHETQTRHPGGFFEVDSQLSKQALVSTVGTRADSQGEGLDSDRNGFNTPEADTNQKKLEELVLANFQCMPSPKSTLSSNSQSDDAVSGKRVTSRDKNNAVENSHMLYNELRTNASNTGTDTPLYELNARLPEENYHNSPSNESRAEIIPVTQGSIGETDTRHEVNTSNRHQHTNERRSQTHSDSDDEVVFSFQEVMRMQTVQFRKFKMGYSTNKYIDYDEIRDKDMPRNEREGRSVENRRKEPNNVAFGMPKPSTCFEVKQEAKEIDEEVDSSANERNISPVRYPDTISARTDNKRIYHSENKSKSSGSGAKWSRAIRRRGRKRSKKNFKKSGTGYFRWRSKYQSRPFHKQTDGGYYTTKSGLRQKKDEFERWTRFKERETIRNNIETALRGYRKTFTSDDDRNANKKVVSYLKSLSEPFAGREEEKRCKLKRTTRYGGRVASNRREYTSPNLALQPVFGSGARECVPVSIMNIGNQRDNIFDYSMRHGVNQETAINALTRGTDFLYPLPKDVRGTLSSDVIEHIIRQHVASNFAQFTEKFRDELSHQLMGGMPFQNSLATDNTSNVPFDTSICTGLGSVQRRRSQSRDNEMHSTYRHRSISSEKETATHRDRYSYDFQERKNEKPHVCQYRSNSSDRDTTHFSSYRRNSRSPRREGRKQSEFRYRGWSQDRGSREYDRDNYQSISPESAPYEDYYERCSANNDTYEGYTQWESSENPERSTQRSLSRANDFESLEPERYRSRAKGTDSDTYHGGNTVWANSRGHEDKYSYERSLLRSMSRDNSILTPWGERNRSSSKGSSVMNYERDSSSFRNLKGHKAGSVYDYRDESRHLSFGKRHYETQGDGCRTDSYYYKNTKRGRSREDESTRYECANKQSDGLTYRQRDNKRPRLDEYSPDGVFKDSRSLPINDEYSRRSDTYAVSQGSRLDCSPDGDFIRSRNPLSNDDCDRQSGTYRISQGSRLGRSSDGEFKRNRSPPSNDDYGRRSDTSLVYQGSRLGRSSDGEFKRSRSPPSNDDYGRRSDTHSVLRGSRLDRSLDGEFKHSRCPPSNVDCSRRSDTYRVSQGSRLDRSSDGEFKRSRSPPSNDDYGRRSDTHLVSQGSRLDRSLDGEFKRSKSPSSNVEIRRWSDTYRVSHGSKLDRSSGGVLKRSRSPPSNVEYGRRSHKHRVSQGSKLDSFADGEFKRSRSSPSNGENGRRSDTQRALQGSRLDPSPDGTFKGSRSQISNDECDRRSDMHRVSVSDEIDRTSSHSSRDERDKVLKINSLKSISKTGYQSKLNDSETTTKASADWDKHGCDNYRHKSSRNSSYRYGSSDDGANSSSYSTEFDAYQYREIVQYINVGRKDPKTHRYYPPKAAESNRKPSSTRLSEERKSGNS